MSKIPQYRHELKYYINQGAYTFLSKKLSLTMEQDKYARKNGGEYLIRSLYLDDMDDSAFREKLDGIDNRERLRKGDYTFLLHRPEPFARRMFAEFATKPLRPCVIVDYMREAYTFPVQDVRVTFDKDVRTGYRSTDLFNAHIPTYRVIDDYDMVLEVKFNQYLPTYIRSLLQLDAHVRSAVSKYCLCRKFEL